MVQTLVGCFDVDYAIVSRIARWFLARNGTTTKKPKLFYCKSWHRALPYFAPENKPAKLPMINIQYEPEDLIVRIPKQLASANYVQEFLERVRIDGILASSQATQMQLEDLSEQIKSDWWAENRDQFLHGSTD